MWCWINDQNGINDQVLTFLFLIDSWLILFSWKYFRWIPTAPALDPLEHFRADRRFQHLPHISNIIGIPKSSPNEPRQPRSNHKTFPHWSQSNPTIFNMQSTLLNTMDRQKKKPHRTNNEFIATPTFSNTSKARPTMGPLSLPPFRMVWK